MWQEAVSPPSVLQHRHLLVAYVFGGITRNFQLGQTADVNFQNTGDFGSLFWACCAKMAPQCCLMSCVRRADEFICARNNITNKSAEVY